MSREDAEGFVRLLERLIDAKIDDATPRDSGDSGCYQGMAANRIKDEMIEHLTTRERQ